ncbi:hypothetical protein [Algoriphagus sp. PAP.12]|uniref:hypothetical protein n=1 Tax=Algoriphagus sp. PAP.12 TaxID=2996678 RepID=UPI00227C2224|nr:hypothetical protein [Algoriphagus sp. PAP.12]
MKTNNKSWMYWLGGLVAGVAAGSLVYQNRDKINQKNLDKMIGSMKKTGNEIGKLVKEISAQAAERSKELTAQAAERGKELTAQATEKGKELSKTVLNEN